jgi:predicted HAD superfamily Cof-like phosphohydrolase
MYDLWYNDVKLFQQKFGVPMPGTPSLLNDEAYNFRVGFLQEELNEFISSYHDKKYEDAIDALIDEIYVVAGTALMMGIPEQSWNEANLAQVNLLFNSLTSYYIEASKYPRFLTDEEYNSAISLLKPSLQDFINYHYFNNIDGCCNALASLSTKCYLIAKMMGLNTGTFKLLWNDVQRANMTKERATDASQSKRKTSLDVIKPPGWVGPDATKILEMMYPGYKERLL